MENDRAGIVRFSCKESKNLLVFRRVLDPICLAKADVSKVMRILSIISRSLRQRCPRCGQGRLFTGWGNVRESCETCGLQLRSREPDTWLIMYVSTAFLTGFFIIGMLWIFPVPASKWLWRGVMALVALALFLGTVPLRKGLAIGFDYLMDSKDTNDGPTH